MYGLKEKIVLPGSDEQLTTVTLREYLIQLIATSNGVEPEVITDEWIEARREELYNNPNHQFVDDPSGLPSPNRTQIAEEAAKAEAFLRTIASL